MPKSSKKKKDKAADFSKAKLKLGKGKQAASNAIDTSFKARSINLPTQSITNNKNADIPSTKRRLTFDDLLAHLKHYSPGTRKDAIIGLRELLEGHNELVESSLTPLLNALVRLIGDEDAGVRKNLLSFFSWLFPRVDVEHILPHSSMLLLFTTSAQTHIFPEIRIDAVRFLDIFLEYVPQLVISGWREGGKGNGSRVLEGYLGILNAGTRFGETDGPLKATSTASVVLTPASKLVVLRSLSTFLIHALTPTGDFPKSCRALFDPSNPTQAWYLKNAFSSEDAYHTFERLLQPSLQAGSKRHPARAWEAEVDEGDDFIIPAGLWARPCWTLDELMNSIECSAVEAGGHDSPEVSVLSFVSHIAQTLHSTLVATFLDCAPTVFSPGSTPSEVETQLVVTIARITHTLYEPILQSSLAKQNDVDNLSSLVGYMTPYFPSTGGADGKFDRACEEFNLIFCELTSLLLNAPDNSFSKHQKRRSQNPNPSHKRSQRDQVLSSQTSRVSDYVIRRLRGQSDSPSQIGHVLGASAYVSLLPTIWALINKPLPRDTTTNEVLCTVIDHALNLSSKSPCKRLTVEFVARLILLSSAPQYHGNMRVGRDVVEDQKFETWLTHLPQVLWEIGASNLLSTETVLRVLLRILQRRSKLVHDKTIASLGSRLAPFFSISHSVRGHLAGPYRNLPAQSAIRRQALDIAVTIIKLGRDVGGLLAAVNLAVEGTEEENYWNHVTIV